MPAFAQDTIARLRLLPSPSEPYLFTAAADLLSKVRMKNFSSGIHPEIDKEGATAEEANIIQDLLVRIVEHHVSHPELGTVLWALGKARDPKLESLFIAHAGRQFLKLSQAHGALSQCLVALEDLGLEFTAKTNRTEMIGDTIDRMDALLGERGITVPL